MSEDNLLKHITVTEILPLSINNITISDSYE